MSHIAHITAISPTKRDPRQATIHVNGKAMVTLPARVINDLDLVVGRAWDERLAVAVDGEVLYVKVYRSAMSKLNRRALSRSELEAKLNQLGHDPKTVNRVLDRLEELSGLNDEQLAHTIVEQALTHRSAGPALLRQKLRKRGIKASTIDTIVDQYTSPHELIDRAASLIRDQSRKMAQEDSLVRRRRLWNLLARRGFDEDTIEQAFEELKRGHEEA